MAKPNKRDLWLLALRQSAIWSRALKFGFSAGLLQVAINQGDLWLRHAAGPGVVIKTIASPLIGLVLVLLTSAATWVQNQANENKYER